jgi:hypothetical protein
MGVEITMNRDIEAWLEDYYVRKTREAAEGCAGADRMAKKLSSVPPKDNDIKARLQEIEDRRKLIPIHYEGHPEGAIDEWDWLVGQAISFVRDLWAQVQHEHEWIFNADPASPRPHYRCSSCGAVVQDIPNKQMREMLEDSNKMATEMYNLEEKLEQVEADLQAARSVFEAAEEWYHMRQMAYGTMESEATERFLQAEHRLISAIVNCVRKKKNDR